MQNCEKAKEVYFSEFVPDSINILDHPGNLTVSGSVLVKHSE